MARTVRNSVQNLRNRAALGNVEDFWALRDVSFDVNDGEVMGIIGRNGAGKSTLLKILTRISDPTTGRAILRGRVGSLLEVGTGFHPELSGRDNVVLNGIVLGMTRSEIDRKFESIVDFSGVEKFLDTPVKRYSSGMKVRLAFAVAAHLEPEILIIDEVLAVGDAEFQKKCLGRMRDAATSGRTVLFVSHNMSAIQQLSDRCVVLHDGRVAYAGPTEDAIERYLHTVQGANAEDACVEHLPRTNANLKKEVQLTRLEFQKKPASFLCDDDIVLNITVRGNEHVDRFRFSMTILRFDTVGVGSFFTPDSLQVGRGKTATFELRLRDLRLAPGHYYCGLSTGTGDNLTGHRDFDVITEALHFEVHPPEGSHGTMGHWAPTWGTIRFAAPEVQRIS